MARRPPRGPRPAFPHRLDAAARAQRHRVAVPPPSPRPYAGQGRTERVQARASNRKVPPRVPGKPGPSAGPQTLRREIRLLEILTAAGRNMSIDELAEALEAHRSVAYRLLRTLEDHGLIARDPGGRIVLGAGLAAASGVSRDLQQAALPELRAVANELGATCLLAVRLDRAEAVTLTSAAPEQSVAITYRPGHRHPLSRGGPGKAILLQLPEDTWPAELRDELASSRAALGLVLDADPDHCFDSLLVALRSRDIVIEHDDQGRIERPAPIYWIDSDPMPPDFTTSLALIAPPGRLSQPRGGPPGYRRRSPAYGRAVSPVRPRADRRRRQVTAGW
ncbi:IclR family transcriptional regulator [Nocardia testacea]|uniref:IclR family transcriptional regulator n=1 Tax=Nocardia testacea TaxID=248551 RepID=A0ABW7VUA8_9NOCA